MIRKFQRQDLEAAVKIWLAANKEAHDFIDPCYWEGYKDAVKEMFLQAEIYVFETEDMMEEIFDETGGIQKATSQFGFTINPAEGDRKSVV